MLFSGGFDDTRWAANAPRVSKMVFIGRNLDAKSLAARFNACLATAENMEAKAKALRFAVGDRVECRTGVAEWSRGTVQAVLYRDANMSPGMVAPYQVLLDTDGRLIFAPKDVDAVVRPITTSMREWLARLGLEQYADAFEEQDMEVAHIRNTTGGARKHSFIESQSAGKRLVNLSGLADDGDHVEAEPEELGS